MVAEADLAPLRTGERFVLWALAYHAHDDGTDARPGRGRLARMGGMSKRQTQRATVRLVKEGFVVEEAKPSPGHPTRYRIVLDRLRESPVTPVEEATGDTHVSREPATGDTHVADGRHGCRTRETPMSQTGDTPRIGNRQEPLLNRQEPKQKHVLERVTPELLPALSAQAPTIPDSVERVFVAWASTQKRPATVKFTADRRRLIEKWLKVYPVDELVAAVQGWQHSSFHRGDNDNGTVYSDIKLLLRDPDHIEKFRNLWQDGPQRGRRMSGLRREVADLLDLQRGDQP
jgi:hypothetical protein